MTIDIDKYSASYDTIINYYNGGAGKDIKRCISMGAFITRVPCVVIAFYLGPYTNWHPDVVQSIKSLTAFYGYTEFLNKPPDSPI